MPLLLRVDVDNAFVPLRNNKLLNFIELSLNYLNENFWAPKFNFIGYNKAFQEFIRDIDEIGVTASIFFKYITIPSENLSDHLLKRKFELGLHLLSATTYRDFIKEKVRVESRLKTKLYGFSKHGDGEKKLSRRHAWRYEPQKYIEWGLSSGLCYFSGNEHGVTSPVVRYNNFFFFQKVFYIEPWARKIKATTSQVIDYANSDYTVIALIHPSNYLRRSSARYEFEKIINKVDKILTIKDFISTL